MRKWPLLIIAGIIFALLFFALAPRSPVASHLEHLDTLESLFGILALVFLFTGVFLRDYETKGWGIAKYTLLEQFSFLIWVVVFSLISLKPLILKVLVTSPIYLVPLAVIEKKKEDKRKTLFVIAVEFRDKS
ncbi:hypothetical protein [Pyrococcus abyssi]|nr:hypothetical protein [Pyrococcus abyssi]